jgi:hypothetical protein
LTGVTRDNSVCIADTHGIPAKNFFSGEGLALQSVSGRMAEMFNGYWWTKDRLARQIEM